tara:strand:- start:184 stop:831 length:648 start_codon:yes stop_codon:yes gene_type:complete
MLFNGSTTTGGGTNLTSATATLGGNIIPVGVDSATMSDPSGTSALTTLTRLQKIGGYNAATSTSNPLTLDQGLNTIAISPETNIPEDLYESQYQIEMDNRLISLTTPDGNTVATPSFVDDDSIASYSVASATYISDIVGTSPADSPILGPRGSRLQIGLRSSLDLQSSTYLFTTLGSTVSDSIDTYYYIDTTVRVTGLTTGNSVDLPVRLFKYKS